MALTTANVRRAGINQAGSTIQNNYANQLVYANVKEVFFVNGLTANSTKTTYDADARAIVQTIVPIGTSYAAQPLATSRQYDVVPIQETGDAVNVIVSYIYQQGNASPTIWTIESSSFAEQKNTNVEYNSSYTAFQSIIVNNYWPNWVFGKKPPAPEMINPAPPQGATVSVFRPAGRIVYTATVYDPTLAEAFEAAGRTYRATQNSVVFRGLAAKSVFCYSVAVTYQPYNGINTVVLVFLEHDPLEGWDPWVMWHSNKLPYPPNVFPYDSDGSPGNGFYQAREYRLADLNALVNMLPGYGG